MPPVVRERWQSLLLFLSFFVAAEPIFQLRTYRPVEVLIVAITVYAYCAYERPNFPKTILVSFVLGVTGVVVSTSFSPYPLRSLDTGILEVIIPYLVFYLFLTFGNDNRRFYIKALTLFVIGAAIIGISQSVAIMSEAARHGQFIVPLNAADFLHYKMGVGYWFPLGIPASYGNVDNFASLWVLLLPLVAGGLYLTRKWWIVACLFIVILGSGLIVYSRSALLISLAAILFLISARAITMRLVSAPLVLAVMVIAALHLNPASLNFYSGGIESFTATLRHPQEHAVESTALLPPSSSVVEPILVPTEKRDPISPELAPDESGSDRALAWRNGLSISRANWLTGTGFDVYRDIEPVLKTPHTMMLARFAEGGILSALSFLILALFAPTSLFLMIRRREVNALKMTCLIAVSAFMLKAVIFGATFAVSSNIVWGFGVALCLAAGTFTQPKCHKSIPSAVSLS